MPDSKIFCNIPWFELNINHDGSYDLCGCQNDRLVGTALGQEYNIKKIPVAEYWNSQRLKDARLRKLGNTPDPMCKMCQTKDSIGYQSNRVKENLKSVIFADAFDRSFKQSPNYQHFEYSKLNQGLTQSTIHSLHINLGHTCNFACRMCSPHSSTRLQTEFKQLGWVVRDQKFDHWTESETGWKNFLDFLEQQAHTIKVIHIIGGEVEFMPKFEFLIDYFIDRGLADTVNISFTTNGSVDYSRHFVKLQKYKRCEIGISIESVEPIGDYIRQGGEIEQILKNILKMNTIKHDNMQLAIRTVPSLLSLPSYASLISWAWTNSLPVDNSLLVGPAWLQAVLLPQSIKQTIINDVSAILKNLPVDHTAFNNQKDPNKIDISIRNECEGIIKLAQLPEPDNVNELRKLCASKLSQWDMLKQTNIGLYSQELYDFLKEYGYNV
jgi:MoaA/NifB/PqqE/SkfB family radical SAM enzyme